MNLKNKDLKPDRKTFFYLSLITLFGFSLIGIILIYFFQQKTLIQVFAEGGHWRKQLIGGFGFGIAAALAAIALIKSPILKETRTFFAQLIVTLNPSFRHIVFYSLCAAVGEEILFRAAIQPHLGIWITSLLFIFLHGYINPYNLPLSIYGIMMIFVSAGIGYLFENAGLLAAMSAHFVFDVVVFMFLRRQKPEEEEEKNDFS